MNCYIPLLQTGLNEIDKAFRIAVGDLSGNIGLYKAGLLETDMPVIYAGAGYSKPWTRDAAFNSYFAGFIAPEVTKNTLLSVLEKHNGKYRIEETYGQYWDRIIWIWGAWSYYLYSGDKDFLKLASEAAANSLKDLEEAEFDPADGLFRGGACFQDGIAAYPDAFVSSDGASGILNYLTDPPENAVKAPTGGGLPLKALSTNCLYLAAYRYTDLMRQELGEAPCCTEKHASLRRALNAGFYSPQSGMYRYLLAGADPDPDRQEGLGLAFVLLFGAADPQILPRLVSQVHITPCGLPCIWPQYSRYALYPGAYARHSGVIWPQVNAAWCCGLAANGFRKEAFQETQTIARLAAEDNMFHEIYHPETGKPYGGLQEARGKGIVEYLSCPRQTWAATGFIQMVLQSLFGMHCSANGISFAPLLPAGIREMKLNNLQYRGALLDITVVKGTEYSLSVNGQKSGKLLPRPGERNQIVFTTDLTF